MQQESDKNIWKSWFCNKVLTKRQILNSKFYDASDFDLKILKSTILNLKNFLKSMILNEKIFWKKQDFE